MHVEIGDLDAALAGELQGQTFLDFYAEKIGEKQCTECGENNWTIESLNTNENVVYPGAVPDKILETYIAVVVMYCDNCGYVKLFNRTPIANWQRNRNA